MTGEGAGVAAQMRVNIDLKEKTKESSLAESAGIAEKGNELFGSLCDPCVSNESHPTG